MVPQSRKQGQGGGDAGEILLTFQFVSFLLGQPQFTVTPPPQGVRTPILQLSAMQEGDYTFELTVTDSSGQQNTAQVTVIVQPGKQLELSAVLKML